VLAGFVVLVVDTMLHHVVVMVVSHLVVTTLLLATLVVAAVLPLARVARLMARRPDRPEVNDRTGARALEVKVPARLHIVTGREDHVMSAETKAVAVIAVTISALELGRTNCRPRVKVVEAVVRLHREIDARGAFEAIVVTIPRAIAAIPGAITGPIVTGAALVPPATAVVANTYVRRLPITV